MVAYLTFRHRGMFFTLRSGYPLFTLFQRAPVDNFLI